MKSIVPGSRNNPCWSHSPHDSSLKSYSKRLASSWDQTRTLITGSLREGKQLRNLNHRKVFRTCLQVTKASHTCANLWSDVCNQLALLGCGQRFQFWLHQMLTWGQRWSWNPSEANKENCLESPGYVQPGYLESKAFRKWKLRTIRENHSWKYWLWDVTHVHSHTKSVGGVGMVFHRTSKSEKTLNYQVEKVAKCHRSAEN